MSTPPPGADAPDPQPAEPPEAASTGADPTGDAGPGDPAVGEGGRPARRHRDPLAAVLIGVLTLLLGFAFTVQVRAIDDDQVLAGAREEDLVRILDEVGARGERLRDQIADERAALRQLTSSDSRSAEALEEARARADSLGILNGTAAAQGPGLRLAVRDPGSQLRVADLLDVIQELRGAGAETMQIDGVRVGLTTAVTGTPGALLLDGRPITAPYEVLVLGSPQNMETALNIPGGVVQHVGSRGGSVTVEQVPDLVVDALRPLPEAQYAAPDADD